MPSPTLLEILFSWASAKLEVFNSNPTIFPEIILSDKIEFPAPSDMLTPTFELEKTLLETLLSGGLILVPVI